MGWSRRFYSAEGPRAARRGATKKGFNPGPQIPQQQISRFLNANRDLSNFENPRRALSADALRLPQRHPLPRR
jgi:hypothetical protein